MSIQYLNLSLQIQVQVQEHEVVLHVQGEGYQPAITFRSGSSQVPKGLRNFQGPDFWDLVSEVVWYKILKI